MRPLLEGRRLMAWAKFDDRWATHPKLLAAGLEAKGLDASGICYAAGQETDGFVPDTALVILAAGHRNPTKVADRLIEVGRWSRDDSRKGYVIHDFDQARTTGRKSARRCIPERVRALVLASGGRRCASCGATSRLSIDHITPVVRGGTNDPSNLQVLCVPCNSSKGDR